MSQLTAFLLLSLLSLSLAVTLVPCSSSTGSVTGDPHFVGFNGQRFEFHGVGGNIYNLLSSESVQINARVLSNGQWGDSRTFLDAVAVEDSRNRLAVACLNSTLVAELNGKAIAVDSLVSEGSMTAYFDRRHAVIATPVVEIAVVRAKNRWAGCYVNTELTLYKDDDTMSSMHGLIGQTARISPSPVSSSSASKFQDGAFAIEVSESDYEITEGHLFGHTFRFDVFTKAEAATGGSRHLLARSRALLQSSADCSACTEGLCASHPDGLLECGMNPDTDTPECYDGVDLTTFCAPSGCPISGASAGPGGPNCDARTVNVGMACGMSFNQPDCDSGYTSLDGGLTRHDQCVWNPDTATCVSEMLCSGVVDSSESSDPETSLPPDVVDLDCGNNKFTASSCSAFTDPLWCEFGMDTNLNQGCQWDAGSNACVTKRSCGAALVTGMVCGGTFVESCFALTNPYDCVVSRQGGTACMYRTGSGMCVPMYSCST